MIAKATAIGGAMGPGKFIASQLRKPAGLFGRLVVARVLNRGNAPMNELTMQLLQIVPDDRVLEVGFGGGDLLARLAPVVSRGSIVGVDFSPDMAALCMKRFGHLVRAGRIALRCASAEDLPYASGEFTKACTVNTIYFWPDPLRALGELWRTLREGGRLVVGFNPKATAEKLPYTRHGFTLYEPDQAQDLMEKAGFRNVRMASGATRLGSFVCAVGTK